MRTLPTDLQDIQAIWPWQNEWYAGGKPISLFSAFTETQSSAIPSVVSRTLKSNPGAIAVGLIGYPTCPDAAPEVHIKIFSDSDCLRLDPEALPDPAQCLSEGFIAETSWLDYRAAIEKVQSYLLSGDCYQINLARRFQSRFHGDPLFAWARLSSRHPAPHTSFFRISPEKSVFGCSPERFLRIQDRIITTEPIKGSRPRGDTPEADQALAESLVNSSKDRAENLMIVDLLRNDLGKVCKPGTVITEKLFELRQFSNVQHLVSTIHGTLNEAVSPLEALLACFPGGSITGAPKKRAMEIIAELEPHPRGFYCGSQVVLDSKGNLDSNILIRTFPTDGDRIYCHGGGGIVIDSDPEQEFAESEFKIRALMNALL